MPAAAVQEAELEPNKSVRHPKPASARRRGTAAYFRTRLNRERPDLAARINRGELSIHAAAVEAGFRKPQLTLPEDIEEAAAALFRRWRPDGARRIAATLLEMAGTDGLVRARLIVRPGARPAIPRRCSV